MTCYEIHQHFVVQFASKLNEIIPGLSQMKMNDWKSFPFLKNKQTQYKNILQAFKIDDLKRQCGPSGLCTWLEIWR